jgi:hypothetical protein
VDLGLADRELHREALEGPGLVAQCDQLQEDDRELNSISHRFLGSALLAYTMPRSEHYLALGLMGGAVINADRFSAYRLGGALPFTSEFPLMLPGYFYEEISAQDFGLLYGLYAIPLGPKKAWSIFAGGATAVVNYLDGLDQSGDWNSGVTGGFSFASLCGHRDYVELK